jgi:CBS domain-containing protein
MAKVFRSFAPAGKRGAPKPICIDKDATIVDASKLMRSYGAVVLIVTGRCVADGGDSSDGEPVGQPVEVGIVSALDIVSSVVAAGLDPAVITAGDIAWPQSSDFDARCHAEGTLRSLCASGNRVFPVMDGSGKIASLVSLADLIFGLAKEPVPQACNAAGRSAGKQMLHGRLR